MKTKLILLPAIAGVFFLSSCSHGPSEEAKKKVTSFDSSWTAMGNMAMGWGDSLSKAVSFCETACKDGDAMECCEHLKGTKDSLMMPCKNDMAMFQDMKKNWDAEMPMWDSLQAKLDGLKEKVGKGEGTDEEVNSVLAELQGAMDKGSKGMEEFITHFNEAKASCMKNMDTCKSGWSAAKCSDKKCPHGKEEKKS